MSNHKGTTLPYRTTPEETQRLIEAINRRRSIEQIQALFPSQTAFQSAFQAAQALGFVDTATSSLLHLGKDYLLQVDKRTEILLNAMCQYEPYGLLLEAIFVRESPTETPINWIINWWSSRDYGVSANNRDEAAVTFGRFIEAVGLGTFMLGRRGKPTRIQWGAEAAKQIKEIINRSEHADVVSTSSEANTSTPVSVEEAQFSSRGEPLQSPQPSMGYMTTVASQDYASMSIPLSGQKIAEVRLPAKLTTKDKKRLLQIMELLIEVDDEQVFIASEE